MRLIKLTLAASALTLALPSSVWAQAAGASDAIVVTARRTSENLQDVPIAVTALSGAQLEQRNVATLDEIAKFAPNIRFDGAAALSGGNYNATVFIRGVGQNDFAIFSDPGVGIYVDDVYYARSIGGVLDSIDIANVQILRGPQGTLFGRNTIGGAVLINTGAPELDVFEGRLEAVAGSFERADVKGYVNIPITEGVAALRIAAASINREGYVRRLFDGGTQGDRNADSARIRFLLTPNEALSFDLGADYTKARETAAPNDLLAVGNAPGITGIPFLNNYNLFVAPSRGVVAPNGAPTLNPSFMTADPYSTWASGANINDLDSWGLRSLISYDFGAATLKSITAYRELKAFFHRDGDNTPFFFRETENDEEQDQFSQEIQLAGAALGEQVKYVVGAYYFRENGSDIGAAFLADGLAPPLAPPPFSPAANLFNFTKNTSYAAYGELDWNFTDSLSVTLGGRYSEDEKEFRIRDVRRRDNFEYVNLIVSDSWSAFTPRVGLNYQVTEDALLYASYARGYKQGGFNGRPLVSAAEVTAYAPETISTYEIGAKTQWFDRAVTLNVAAFYSDYEDIQLTVNDTPSNFVANAAQGTVEGAEAEVVVAPTSWFSADLNVGYLEAAYTEVGTGLGPTQTLPIRLTSKFVKAPKWTASGGFNVSHDLGNDSEITFRGDFAYYSSMFNDVGNTPIIRQGEYTLLNARLTWRPPGQHFDVAVFGTNLTDELYMMSGNASAAFGLAEAAYGPPRQWGVSVGYNF